MKLKNKDNKFPSVMSEIYIRIQGVKATIFATVMVNDERILIGVNKLDDSFMGDSIFGFLIDTPGYFISKKNL